METRSKNVISSVEEAATRERILRCQRTDPTENYSRIYPKTFLFVKKNSFEEMENGRYAFLSFRIVGNDRFLSKSLRKLLRCPHNLGKR